jgi:hypothetical protein
LEFAFSAAAVAQEILTAMGKKTDEEEDNNIKPADLPRFQLGGLKLAPVKSPAASPQTRRKPSDE